jgi:hypothetical protein
MEHSRLIICQRYYRKLICNTIFAIAGEHISDIDSRDHIANKKLYASCTKDSKSVEHVTANRRYGAKCSDYGADIEDLEDGHSESCKCEYM